MRLADERIKAGLLHSDQEVRSSIAYYFSGAFSRDPEIVPLAIRAIEQYGWNEAFQAYNFLRNLTQSDESVRWLIDQLQRLQPADDEALVRLQDDLLGTLLDADPDCLQQHVVEIRQLSALDEDGREALDELLALPHRSTEELWQELSAMCDQYEGEEYMPDHQFDLAGRLVKALAKHPKNATDLVLRFLNGEAGDLDYWLTGFAVRLAGELRLESAVPGLVQMLHDEADWIEDEACEALIKIGTFLVVAELASQFPVSEREFRHAVSCTLEHIHSDLSVKACLDLFSGEEDHGIRCSLLQSALMNFATEAIEPARQYILANAKEPELLEVRDSLLTICKLTGERFPEFDAWLEDSKTDVEFRRQWYEDHPSRFGELDELDEDVGVDDDFFDDDCEDDEWDEDDPVDDLFADEETESSPVTFVRRGERIGRNDPCPCGSGKKYKNCCYRKGTADETDLNHATAMSNVSQTQAPPKYPIGTVALYGPDDQRTTKIVAAVIRRHGDEPTLQRWVGNKVQENPKVHRQIEEFFQKHLVKSVVATEGNMGCPHEEGEDFPLGGDCPFCPYWQGKQGTNRRD